MRTEKITQRNWVLPFCKDSTEKKLELVCFYNDCTQNADIEIENTVLRYGIPASGYRYFVLAEDAFVIGFDAIYPAECGGKDIMFTGQDYPWGYEFHDRGWFCRIDKQRHEFCSGSIRMSTDGRSWIDGYPNPNPTLKLVYLKNEVGISADGGLLARNACDASAGLQFILGCQDGELCITSDRKIYKATARRCRKLPAPAVDIRRFSYGYLVMDAQGEVFFSSNGLKWKRKAVLTATAIAAGSNYMVAAKPGGTLAIYKYDNKTDSLAFHEEIQTPAEHITDLVVINSNVDVNGQVAAIDLIGWESADCTFDFLRPDKNGTYRSLRG